MPLSLRLHTNLSLNAYQRRQTGTGHTYQERLQQHTQCPHCNTTLKYGFLKTHVCQLHGMELHEDLLQEDSTTQFTATSPFPCRTSIPRGVTKYCLVPQCFGRFKTHDGMRWHFMTHHPLDSICILEEGSQPLTRCTKCNMQVP
jgi:hypothetical protein